MQSTKLNYCQPCSQNDNTAGEVFALHISDRGLIPAIPHSP